MEPMALEYTFWDDSELTLYGVQARGRTLIPEFVRTLRGQWKTVHLVDPAGGEFKGEAVLTSLSEVPGAVQSVLLVAEPASASDAVKECIDHGVRRIWVDTRGDSKAASETARKAGLEVVEERCPMLTMPGGIFVHRIHAGLLRAFGRLPRP